MQHLPPPLVWPAECESLKDMMKDGDPRALRATTTTASACLAHSASHNSNHSKPGLVVKRPFAVAATESKSAMEAVPLSARLEAEMRSFAAPLDTRAGQHSGQTGCLPSLLSAAASGSIDSFSTGVSESSSMMMMMLMARDEALPAHGQAEVRMYQPYPSLRVAHRPVVPPSHRPAATAAVTKDPCVAADSCWSTERNDDCWEALRDGNGSDAAAAEAAAAAAAAPAAGNPTHVSTAPAYVSSTCRPLERGAAAAAASVAFPLWAEVAATASGADAPGLRQSQSGCGSNMHSTSDKSGSTRSATGDCRTLQTTPISGTAGAAAAVAASLLDLTNRGVLQDRLRAAAAMAVGRSQARAAATAAAVADTAAANAATAADAAASIAKSPTPAPPPAAPCSNADPLSPAPPTHSQPLLTSHALLDIIPHSSPAQGHQEPARVYSRDSPSQGIPQVGSIPASPPTHVDPGSHLTSPEAAAATAVRAAMLAAVLAAAADRKRHYHLADVAPDTSVQHAFAGDAHKRMRVEADLPGVKLDRTCPQGGVLKPEAAVTSEDGAHAPTTPATAQDSVQPQQQCDLHDEMFAAACVAQIQSKRHQPGSSTHRADVAAARSSQWLYPKYLSHDLPSTAHCFDDLNPYACHPNSLTSPSYLHSISAAAAGSGGVPAVSSKELADSRCRLTAAASLAVRASGQRRKGMTKKEKEQEKRAMERVAFARLHTILPSAFLAHFARRIGRHVQPGQKQADFGTLLEAAAGYIGSLQKRKTQLQAAVSIAQMREAQLTVAATATATATAGLPTDNHTHNHNHDYSDVQPVSHTFTQLAGVKGACKDSIRAQERACEQAPLPAGNPIVQATPAINSQPLATCSSLLSHFLQSHNDSLECQIMAALESGDFDAAADPLPSDRAASEPAAVTGGEEMAGCGSTLNGRVPHPLSDPLPSLIAMPPCLAEGFLEMPTEWETRDGLKAAGRASVLALRQQQQQLWEADVHGAAAMINYDNIQCGAMEMTMPDASVFLAEAEEGTLGSLGAHAIASGSSYIGGQVLQPCLMPGAMPSGSRGIGCGLPPPPPPLFSPQTPPHVFSNSSTVEAARATSSLPKALQQVRDALAAEKHLFAAEGSKNLHPLARAVASMQWETLKGQEDYSSILNSNAAAALGAAAGIAVAPVDPPAAGAAAGAATACGSAAFTYAAGRSNHAVISPSPFYPSPSHLLPMNADPSYRVSAGLEWQFAVGGIRNTAVTNGSNRTPPHSLSSSAYGIPAAAVSRQMDGGRSCLAASERDMLLVALHSLESAEVARRC